MAVINGSDYQRPGFDLALEILISLPKAPASITLAALVRDMDLSGQRAANSLLRTLRDAGFLIRVTNHPKNGRVAYLERVGWLDAEAAGQAYWDRVWGDQGAGGGGGGAAP